MPIVDKADLALEIGEAPVALVGMSSPNGTVGDTLPNPGARSDERGRIAALSPADEDRGLPVEDLPPLIEPTADPFETAMSSGEVPAPAPAPSKPPEADAHPAPSTPEPKPAEPVQIVSRPWPTVTIPTVGPTTARLLAAPRSVVREAKRRPYLSAGLCAAILILVGAAYVAGVRPFARNHPYPAADAPKDPAQRLAYFQRGAQAGDASAEFQLAVLYAKGEGVTQDYATSATWFRAAANQGVARAQYDLGVVYERGRGVSVDLTEAANWYLKAAQAGYPLAQYNLAVCYVKGQGLHQDLNEAVLWYHRAAAQGVLQAMINLGTMYEKGEGVTASPVDAYAWYLAAGRRGDTPSARRAEDVLNSMAKLDQIRAEALASDVANSIHDPAPGVGETAAGAPNAAEQ